MFCDFTWTLVPPANADDRSDTVSVFNGPPPPIKTYKNHDEEIRAVGNWIAGHAKAGPDR
jgi:hypothetical protein